MDDLRGGGRHGVLRPALGHQRRLRAEGVAQALRDRRRVDGDALGQELVGQPEQHLLAVGQMGLRNVDAAVGDDPLRQVHGPRALGPPGQQLTTDGVTHVVGEQGQAVDSQCGNVGGGDVGLERHGVGAVGFCREPVAEHVEQEHTTTGPQAVEHGGIVERGSGEPVQHQERRVAFGPDGGCVHSEDACATELAERTDGLPARTGADRHVPASLCTTGASVSQASDSMDQ